MTKLQYPLCGPQVYLQRAAFLTCLVYGMILYRSFRKANARKPLLFVTVFMSTRLSARMDQRQFRHTDFLRISYSRLKPKFYVIFRVRLKLVQITDSLCGRGSAVGVASAYRLDGPGIESRRGRGFPHLSRPAEAHPASCTMGTGSLLGVRCGRGVTLTPHPLLVPRSKIE